MKKVCVAVLLNGGIGTYLMELNFIKCLYDKYSDDLRFDVFASNNDAVNEGLMKGQYFVNQYYLRKEFGKNMYDLEIDLNWFVKVVSVDYDRVKQINHMFYELVNLWVKFQENEKTRHLVGNDNRFDPNIWTYALARGENRLNITDIDGRIGVGKEYDFKLMTNLKKNDVLHKFGLDSNEYITMQSGVDAAANTLCAPKQWPHEYYEELCVLLKENYPNILLVQLGEEANNLPIEGVDKCLLGKTSFEELKSILKYAKLHIDGDCGMLHMRKAMHAGTSVAFWGQMSPEIVGYTDDINIVSKTCPSWCGKLYTGWKQRCPLYNHPKCMYEIKPEYVMQKIKLFFSNRIVVSKLKQKKEDINLFLEENNIIIDPEWYESWFSKQTIFSYEIKDIKISDLVCKKLTPEGYIICSVSEMPQYKFLTGDKSVYVEYMRLNDMYNVGHEHSYEKYELLLASLEKGVDNKYLVVIDGTDRVLDGAHRVAYMAAKNGLESNVKVLKIYGNWMIKK